MDLFATPVTLGMADGITGTYRSARLAFPRPGAGGSSDPVALALGSASKPSDPAAPPVYFRVFATWEDVARSVADAELDGCEFEPANVAGDGTVTLTVDPSVWFDLVDFSDVDPGSSQSPTTITPGDVPQVAFALGVAQRAAYRFSYSEM